MNHLTAWRAAPSSSVSSSITRANIIFVFTSLFPTLFLLIAAVVVINYGLERFTNLGITFTNHSAHILFKYKLVLVILKLGSKLNVQLVYKTP